MMKVQLIKWTRLATLCLTVYCVLFAQTRVSLSRQAQSPDFSSFSGTKPVQVGAALPTTCAVGQMFFNTAVAAGQNLYGCSPANQWSSLGGAPNGSIALPALTGTPGLLTTNGTTLIWGNLGTGGSGALDCTSTAGQCDLVPSVVPFKASANAFTGLNTFSLLQAKVYTVASLPTCNAAFEGLMEAVSDASGSPVYLGPISGGGTIHMPVYCNGTSWIAH